MPLDVSSGHPTLFIRRRAYERAGLTRAMLDETLGLAPDEFNVEGDLVALGPVYDEEALSTMLDELERNGLQYFEDYFELSGNWPDWLRVLVVARRD
jgi:hypothetical protein